MGEDQPSEISTASGDSEEPVGRSSDLSNSASSTTLTLPGAAKDLVHEDEPVEHPSVSTESDTRYHKGGFVIRKHLLESADNKAKHRNWYEQYLTTENGQLRAYSVSGASLSDNAHRRSVFRLSGINAGTPHGHSALPPPVMESASSYAIGNNWKVIEVKPMERRLQY